MAAAPEGSSRGGGLIGLLVAVSILLLLGCAWFAVRASRIAADRLTAEEELTRTAAAEREAAARARDRALKAEAALRQCETQSRALIEAQLERARAATPEQPDGAARLPAEAPEGAPTVRGALSREVIQRIVRQRVGEVQRCYEEGLKARPDLAGRVVVLMVIASSGEVASARAESSTLGAPGVERCIADAVKRWGFPRPSGGGSVIVRYPFVFRGR